MDTIITSLPSQVGAILMENISIIQIVSMFSIGAYNALETGIVTFDTFKNYRGLYFWSMLITSWGILLHAIPAMTRFISQASNLPTAIPFIMGWYAMVTGQAFVLYSRLHLLIFDISKIRWVLWMIIANACILHIPMTVLFCGVNSGDARFSRPAAIYDRIQLTGFCMQDLVLCGIYLYKALRTFKSITRIRGREGRKVIIHLILVNILGVVLNILLLLTEYKLHYIQVSFKTVVYSIKLKLEFAVLNRLRSLMHSSSAVCQQEPTQQHKLGSVTNCFRKTPGSSHSTPQIRAHQYLTPTGETRRSTRSSSYGYHDTLRDMSNTVLNEINSSPTPSENSSDLSPAGSSETLPTLHLSLSGFAPRLEA